MLNDDERAEAIGVVASEILREAFRTHQPMTYREAEIEARLRMLEARPS